MAQSRSRRLALIAHLLLVLATWSLTGAGTLPGLDTMEDLELSREKVLYLDGGEVEDVEIYYSEYHVAWLVRTSSRLGSFLISPRGDSVHRVSLDSFRKSSSTTALLERGSATELLARYSNAGGAFRFELDGRVFELRPAPPMLGRQAFDSVLERHPAFDQQASAYQSKARLDHPPAKATVAAVTVKVYFASWSQICQRIVPKILGVEKEWQYVRFEYYGLPKPLVDDAHAVELGISGVPTVLLLRGDEEIDRLTGRQLDDPADALRRAFSRL